MTVNLRQFPERALVDEIRALTGWEEDEWIVRRALHAYHLMLWRNATGHEKRKGLPKPPKGWEEKCNAILNAGLSTERGKARVRLAAMTPAERKRLKTAARVAKKEALADMKPRRTA